jgi:hypothetical protein
MTINEAQNEAGTCYFILKHEVNASISYSSYLFRIDV